MWNIDRHRVDDLNKFEHGEGGEALFDDRAHAPDDANSREYHVDRVGIPDRDATRPAFPDQLRVAPRFRGPPAVVPAASVNIATSHQAMGAT
jgi:hypothetical protein